jgi:tetrahydromethanopterin S-methyltransferase subunit B
MKPLLMIMNPRKIPVCMDALESLDIDKVWLKNWTERELVNVIAGVINSTDHDVIGLLSDDTVPGQEALNLILESFEPSSVYTGYCNMDEDKEEVNLSRKPLIVKSLASYDCYDFPPRSEVDNYEGLYKSYFTGFAMTFMSKDMWLKYPFDCIGEPGYQSDYRLSCRLQEDGVNIWATPGAFMKHLRLDESTKHLEGGTVLVGNGLGTVVWDLQ